MAKRMASQGVGGQQREVRQQDERADADAKPAVEPERIPHVPPQNCEKNQRQIKKIPVDVLQDQWKRSLSEVFLPRLAHGAGRWIRPKSLVIGPAVVVARHSKAARRPQNEHGSCNPNRHPAWVWTKPTIMGGAE